MDSIFTTRGKEVLLKDLTIDILPYRLDGDKIVIDVMGPEQPMKTTRVTMISGDSIAISYSLDVFDKLIFQAVPLVNLYLVGDIFEVYKAHHPPPPRLNKLERMLGSRLPWKRSKCWKRVQLGERLCLNYDDIKEHFC